MGVIKNFENFFYFKIVLFQVIFNFQGVFYETSPRTH